MTLSACRRLLFRQRIFTLLVVFLSTANFVCFGYASDPRNGFHTTDLHMEEAAGLGENPSHHLIRHLKQSSSRNMSKRNRMSSISSKGNTTRKNRRGHNNHNSRKRSSKRMKSAATYKEITSSKASHSRERHRRHGNVETNSKIGVSSRTSEYDVVTSSKTTVHFSSGKHDSVNDDDDSSKISSDNDVSFETSAPNSGSVGNQIQTSTPEWKTEIPINPSTKRSSHKPTIVKKQHSKSSKVAYKITKPPRHSDGWKDIDPDEDEDDIKYGGKNGFDEDDSREEDHNTLSPTRERENNTPTPTVERDHKTPTPTWERDNSTPSPTRLKENNTPTPTEIRNVSSPPPPNPPPPKPPTTSPNQAYACIDSSVELFRTFVELPTLEENLVAYLILCPGSNIVLSSEVDITGKSFTLECPPGEICSVSGGSNTRLFRGTPYLAKFFNIQFEDGMASFGAAVYMNGGTATFRNCGFRNNHVHDAGGAVYMNTGSLVNFDSCSFWDNTAEYGGALYTLHANVSFVRSIFAKNHASMNAGAVFVDRGSFVKISNSTIWRNSAGDAGGAISVQSGARLNLLNDTVFKGNFATTGSNPDLLIDDDFNNETFVFCDDDSARPVVFCDGIDQIMPTSTTTTTEATNCLSGAVNGFHSLCRL